MKCVYCVDIKKNTFSDLEILFFICHYGFVCELNKCTAISEGFIQTLTSYFPII